MRSSAARRFRLSRQATRGAPSLLGRGVLHPRHGHRPGVRTDRRPDAPRSCCRAPRRPSTRPARALPLPRLAPPGGHRPATNAYPPCWPRCRSAFRPTTRRVTGFASSATSLRSAASRARVTPDAIPYADQRPSPPRATAFEHHFSGLPARVVRASTFPAPATVLGTIPGIRGGSSCSESPRRARTGCETGRPHLRVRGRGAADFEAAVSSPRGILAGGAR